MPLVQASQRCERRDLAVALLQSFHRPERDAQREGRVRIDTVALNRKPRLRDEFLISGHARIDLIFVLAPRVACKGINSAREHDQRIGGRVQRLHAGLHQRHAGRRIVKRRIADGRRGDFVRRAPSKQRLDGGIEPELLAHVGQRVREQHSLEILVVGTPGRNPLLPRRERRIRENRQPLVIGFGQPLRVAQQRLRLGEKLRPVET